MIDILEEVDLGRLESKHWSGELSGVEPHQAFGRVWRRRRP